MICHAWWRKAFTFAVLTSAALFFSAGIVQGVLTRTVTNTNDAGPGSLRQTLAEALQGDIINFHPSLNGQAITLTSAQLTINVDVTITGPGANLLTVRRSSASGTPLFRIFQINSGHTVSISGLRISNGLLPDSHGQSDDRGAGILNDRSSLTLTGCTLDGNVGNEGGGLCNSSHASGQPASVTISGCAFSGNNARRFGGAGLYNNPSSGGTATLKISNTTISGNSFGDGGTALLNRPLSGGTASATITNSTLIGSSSGSVVSSSGAVSFGNTILLNTTTGLSAGTINVSGSGAVMSHGYNVVSDAGGGYFTSVGDQPNTNPMLGPLQNNGGPTFTHAPLHGSAAIDKGKNLATDPTGNAVNSDQRGRPRPVRYNSSIVEPSGGDGSDIGAVELSPIQFSAAGYNVSENAGSVSLTVTRTGNTSQPATVHYATSDGSATAASDYNSTAGDLAFSSGEISKTVVVQLLDDSFYEGNETFFVTLSSPSGGDLGLAIAEVTIGENDSAPTVQFSGANYTVNEGAGSAVVTVTKNGMTAVSATVNYVASNGTAVSGTDWGATSGTLSFAAAETTKEIAIPIGDDSLYESNETFNVALSAPAGATLGSPAGATVTILDNDAAPAIQFTSASFSVNESGANAVITVTKTGGTELNATVHYETNNGTANAGSDYTAASGDITFSPSETSKDILVPILDETLFEGNESFTVSLASPSGAILGSTSTTTVTIVDNDAPPTPTPTATPTATVTPTPTATPTPFFPPQPLNISTRLRVQNGDNVLIGGLIVSGNDPKEVMIRAIGPSLGNGGVTNPLPDPSLDLYDSENDLVGSNNNWQDLQRQQIEDTGLAPKHTLESALLITLDPNTAYTAVVRSKDGTPGIGLVEVYDLALGANAKLANISTRGRVETGDNVMIAGFIVGGAPSDQTGLVVRALGPSLSDFGVPSPLQDPTLVLYDADGNAVGSNDNWQEGQQPEVTNSGLAPKDERESALYVALGPGSYTAIVTGKNGETGVGLVEVYNTQ